MRVSIIQLATTTTTTTTTTTSKISTAIEQQGRGSTFTKAETKSKNKWLLQLKKFEEYSKKIEDSVARELSNVKRPEVMTYDLEKIATATNNFDPSNKLGQGGFGQVYKVH